MRAVAFIAMALLGCGNGSSNGAGNGSSNGAGTGTGAGTSAGAEMGAGELVVEMKGFRDDTGSALVGLYVSSDGFPSDGAKAHRRLEVPISGGLATARFARAPATTVAVGVLHDADGDKKMKTGTFGIPKEGYGVSRDAAARFGPPKFEDASFALAAEQTTTIVITMRY